MALAHVLENLVLLVEDFLTKSNKCLFDGPSGRQVLSIVSFWLRRPVGFKRSKDPLGIWRNESIFGMGAIIAASANMIPRFHLTNCAC
jgi:hypothetical protein